MARLWSSGIELGSVTNAVEFSTVTGAPEVNALYARTGDYGLRVNNNSASERINYAFSPTNQTAAFYSRCYIKIIALPTAASEIVLALSTAAVKTSIRLRTDGKLELWNLEDNAQVGSTSSAALSLNTWYRIGFKVDTTTIATTALEVQVDGVTVASGTCDLAAGINRFSYGHNAADATFDVYYDDLAINDTSGSVQNSWPGAGKIIHLNPNAAGDSNMWLDTTGGAGTASNYTLVDETPPNDATDLVRSPTLNDIDMYNVTDSGLASADTVTLIQVGLRLNNLTAADSTTAVRVRAEKTSGGTVSESANIVPNTTSWVTHSSATDNRNYPLTLYQDPDAVNWTKTTLDSMQIGLKITAANVRAIQVSKVWALVDYVPSATTRKNLPLLGVG